MQSGGKTKSKRTVDCSEAPGNSVHSRVFAYSLPGLLSWTPYRCVTGHGNKSFLPFESPANGTCIEKKKKKKPLDEYTSTC